MKKITILLLFLFMTSPVLGAVFTKVCEADGNTPFNGGDIMVGTKLTIIVWSDDNEYWGDEYGDDGGSLAIEEAYWNYGVLSAIGPQVGGDWTGSHFPAAGDEAAVYDWEESGIDGFDLYTGSTDIEAGNWFIIDYTALDIGDCNVGFYDHRISWDEPIYYIAFSQVRTRDFNNDTKVDFSDFAIFASHWEATNCNEANGWCEGTDLNTDGNVDSTDLMLFCEYWLAKTEY
jgi:hypothetical protein